MRTSIFILSHFEEHLIKLHHDELLMFINELPKTDFYKNEEILKKYERDIRKIKVSKQLILRFKEEEGRINEISERRELSDMLLKEIKHPIIKDGRYINVYFSN